MGFWNRQGHHLHTIRRSLTLGRRLFGTMRHTNAPPFPWHLSHSIVHLLHWQLGTVVTATDCQGDVWVGFRCDHCGKICGVEPAYQVWRRRPQDRCFT